MRKYLLPLAVFAAIGAVIVILVKSGDEPTPPARPEPVPDVKPKPGKTDPTPLSRRDTPTSLREHKWLSELERSLGREDMSHAYFFRGKVCEDLDAILENAELTRNLLDAIRSHGVGSDDLRRRDVVLPILRVLRHPEATQMIENEYYKAKNEGERMMLLEAMSHDYHNPDRAAVWAIERALNSESAEHRARAFEVIEYFSNDAELIVDTARQIYDSTTRPAQRLEMVNAISEQSGVEKTAVKWLRASMRAPHPSEIGAVIQSIDGWGDADDAAMLETLAMEHPAMADFMRDRARAVRETLKQLAGEEVEPERPPKPREEPPEEPSDE